MIGIYIPTKGYLALPEDLVFSLTIPSPLWFGGDATVIPGSYSLPIRLAANEVNRAALGFPEFLNRKDFARSIEGVQLYLNGNYYDTGVLWVKMANPAQYQVQLVFGAATLQGLKDKTLKSYEFPADEFVVSMPSYWQTFIETFYNTGNFTFSPVAKTDEDGLVHEYRHIGGTLVKYLLQQIFTAEGYVVTDDVFTLTPYKNVAILGDNLYDVTLESGTSTKIEYQHWVPNMPTLSFLKDLAKDFGLAYVIDSQRKKVRIMQFKTLLSAKFADLTDRLRSAIEISYEDQRQVKRMGSTVLRPPFRENDDEVQLDTDGEEITSGLYSLSSFLGFVDHGSQVAPRITGTYNDVVPGDFIENVDPLKTVSEALIFFRSALVDGDGANYNGLRLSEATQHLHWNDDDELGLYDVNWKKWLAQLPIDVEADMLWRWEDVWNIKDLLLKRILIYDEVGGGWQRFLIKEATISIDNRTGLKKTKQTLAQIRNW